MGPHNTAFPWLFSMALLISLVGCRGEKQEFQNQKATLERLIEIMHAEVVPVSPEQVAEAFALGSDATDLQRDILQKELVGRVVEWRLPVYEVEFGDGVYKITSQPIPIKSNQAFQLLRASVFLIPLSDHDQDLMRKTKTNDIITIRGIVRDIVLRTVVVIKPAVLVSQ